MIQTEDLQMTYGRFQALKGINLEVKTGDIYGFVGPNGAGKTSTIRILTTLMRPTKGTATVMDTSVLNQPAKVRGLIGYMPDEFGVYPDMTVNEYLHFFAAAYDLPRRGRATLVDGLLSLVDLEHKKTDLVGSLSRGMQQRLGLARTLVHDPPVLILDEPASGLDPRARIDIRDILLELKSMGKTILLSSHILSELQEVCTRIGVLVDGQLRAQGTLDQVIDQAQLQRTLLVGTDDNARTALVLGELGCVQDSFVEDDQVVAVITADADIFQVSAHLQAKGIGLRKLKEEELTLERVFMELTESVSEEPTPGEPAVEQPALGDAASD